VFCALSEAFSPECRDRWRVRRRGTANPPPIRRLDHDRTLPPADALGRIRDAFHEYDGVASPHDRGGPHPGSSLGVRAVRVRARE
jgi:hypothetical protein